MIYFPIMISYSLSDQKTHLILNLTCCDTTVHINDLNHKVHETWFWSLLFSWEVDRGNEEPDTVLVRMSPDGIHSYS